MKTGGVIAAVLVIAGLVLWSYLHARQIAVDRVKSALLPLIAGLDSGIPSQEFEASVATLKVIFQDNADRLPSGSVKAHDELAHDAAALLKDVLESEFHQFHLTIKAIPSADAWPRGAGDIDIREQMRISGRCNVVRKDAATLLARLNGVLD